MSRNFLCFVFLLSCIPCCLYGQYNIPENRHWIFGTGAWVDFNGVTPSGAALSSISGHGEANASVSDATGQLLFYTNGSVVWNRNHISMSNGNPLHAHGTAEITASSSQGTLIVPVPDTPHKYYIFSLTNIQMCMASSNFYKPGALYYSVVDMTLNGGLGDVEAGRKWIALDSGFTEKIVAVRGNRCNVWILSHAQDTTLYKAFEINRYGINPAPVISRYKGLMGNTDWWGCNSFWTFGQMAISPDRKKLAEVHANASAGYVFDFDANTGIVSNPMEIPLPDKKPQGVCFSPDNSKLYISCNDASHNADTLFQFNLLAGSAQAILQSKTGIGRTYYSKLLIGPDDKVYMPELQVSGFLIGGFSLGRLDQPNLPGSGSSYVTNAVTLSGMASIGMPNLVVTAPVGGDTLYVRVDTTFCSEYDHIVLGVSAGYDTYVWDDGSTGPVRTVHSPGVYRVICRDVCHTRIDSFIVHPEPFLSGRERFVMCTEEDTVMLHVPSDYLSYSWNDGTSDSTRMITAPGLYWVHSRAYCSGRGDTFVVDRIDLLFSLGNDTVICTGEPLSLHISAPDVAYLWSDGSTDSIFRVMQTGTYWLELTKEDCRYSDTISVYITEVSQDLGADKMFCHREEIALTLEAQAPPGAAILWHDGSSERYWHVQDTGTYWVTVSDMDCTGSDTLRIEKTYCDCLWNMPTAFTPNNDGRNDVFRPVVEPGCPVSKFSFAVYNRWGECVFRSHDANQGWDGYFNGLPAESGVYYYIVELETPAGWNGSMQGDVTLIR